MSTSYPDAGEMRIRRSGSATWISIPANALNVQQVASFPQKVTTGETNKGSHPLLSTWGFDGLPGGHGITKHDGTTTKRYRIGLVDTHNAAHIASPKKAVAISGTSNPFMPHNDLVVSGTRRFYGTYGNDLYIFDESGDTMTDTTYNLSANAVNPGVAFQGTGTLSLFIPCGTTGYATWDGTTLTNVATAVAKPAARDFVVLNKTLICVDTSNQLWYTTDGSTWTSYGSYGKFEAGVSVRRLEIYKNGYGDKTVHAVTDNGLYAFDPAGPTLYDTDLSLPPHPYQGTAIERFRDQLYVASGMNAFSWNGSAVAPMGLDRNQGLPHEYAGTTGYISDLCSDVNYLYALVGAGDPEYHSLHAWNGEGWNMLWRGTSSGNTTSKMVVSSAQGGYRLWWGRTNSAMTLPLSVSFANTEELADLSDTGYEHSWFIETGEQAFEMDGYSKIIASVGWSEYSQTDGRCSLSYRINGATSYTGLEGYVFAAGSGTSSTASWADAFYEFGYDATNARFYGEPVTSIEFKIIGGSSGPPYYDGPDIIRDFVCTFQKVVEGYRAWSCSVDLKRLYDNGQEDIADLINDLVLSNEYCDFQYQQEIIRVKFSSWSGVDETGQASHGGMRRLTILEIPATP